MELLASVAKQLEAGGGVTLVFESAVANSVQATRKYSAVELARSCTKIAAKRGYQSTARQAECESLLRGVELGDDGQMQCRKPAADPYAAALRTAAAGPLQFDGVKLPTEALLLLVDKPHLRCAIRLEVARAQLCGGRLLVYKGQKATGVTAAQLNQRLAKLRQAVADAPSELNLNPVHAAIASAPLPHHVTKNLRWFLESGVVQTDDARSPGGGLRTVEEGGPVAAAGAEGKLHRVDPTIAS
jgi:hypothetical protein